MSLAASTGSAATSTLRRATGSSRKIARGVRSPAIGSTLLKWLAAIACVATLCLATLCLATPARAQEPTPRETAERVHREGRYPSDVTVLVPEPSSGEGAMDPAGRGRGPRGETSVDGERAASEAPPDAQLPPWVRDFFEWLGDVLGGVSGPLGWLFLALAGAALIALIVFFLASMRFGKTRIEGSARSEEARDGPVDPLLYASGAPADELAAQGRFREAIHALFLESLERIGGLEGRQRARTARELVLAVEARHPGRAELGELLDLTELVWFGGRDATEGQYLSARALRDVVVERSRGVAA